MDHNHPCHTCGACIQCERCHHCGHCRNCGRYIMLPYLIYPSPSIPLPWSPYPIGVGIPWDDGTTGGMMGDGGMSGGGFSLASGGLYVGLTRASNTMN